MNSPGCSRWALVCLLAGAPAFADGLGGAFFRPQASSGAYGFALTGNFGASNLGLKSLVDGNTLVAWTGEAALATGIAAYEHPYHALFGGLGQGQVELAWRFAPEQPWSPYLGLRASAMASAILQAGVPWNGGNRANNQGDLMGPLALGQLALGGGASFLRPTRSLLVEVDALLEGDSAQAVTPARLFWGGILHARWDATGHLFALAEVSYAVTPVVADLALQTLSRTSRWNLALAGLRTFGTRWFGGFAFSLQRESTLVSYLGGLGYDTSAPLSARVTLTAGYGL